MNIKSQVTFFIIHLVFHCKNSCVSGSTSSVVYLGCFQVQPQQTLGGWNTMSTSMTIKTCKDFCSTNHLYGVQQSDKCFCGDILPSNIIKPQTECRMSCSGRITQTCGGNNTMDIYINPKYKQKHDLMYMGCYQDQPIRIVAGKHIRSKFMTIETCKYICTKEDNQFYGIQNSDQCFCGESLTTDIPSPEIECNTSCSGNKQGICGGTDRIKIYVNPVYKVYMGCYEARPFKNLARKLSPTLSIENCKNFCVKGNSTQFYGVQKRRACFCGDSLPTNSRPKFECNIKCMFSNWKICIGRIKIYRNPGYTSGSNEKSEKSQE